MVPNQKRLIVGVVLGVMTIIGLVLVSTHNVDAAETDTEPGQDQVTNITSTNKSTEEDVGTDSDDSNLTSSEDFLLGDRFALIIVSGYNGTDPTELDKAISLFYYLLDHDYSAENVIMLCNESCPVSEGAANLANIEDGFQYLKDHSTSLDDVLIHISDHNTQNATGVYLKFEDGNLSTNSIAYWMDFIQYDYLTFIMNGNRSGLVLPLFQNPDRTIMSSMRSNDTVHPDNFNITRSLLDPESDSNHDNFITFEEAFYHEFDLLVPETGQVPRIWISS